MRKLIMIITCLGITNVMAGDENVPGNILDKYSATSLLQIISNPNLYDGKQVFVEGYLVSGFEESALYVCKDHAKHGMTTYAVWIKASSEELKKYNHQYVVVAGLFDKTVKGHMGVYVGAIKSIDRIYTKRKSFIF